MGFFSFPHTRTYDSDLGWLIRHLKGIDEKLDQYLENSVITFADPIQWDITEQYTALKMVVDSDGTAYLSKQPVPAGVDISNTDYWMPIFNYDDNINDLRATIAANEGESMTASAPRVVGDLVYIRGVLYEVTADMPAGTAYITGANCELSTVSDRIQEIKTGITAAIQAEADAREQAIQAEADAREQAINAETDAREQAINAETDAREAADTLINQSINNLQQSIEILKNAYITPQDFGAVGNGVADDTQAFLDMFADDNKAIFIPYGTYYITRTLVIPDKTRLLCAGSLLFADNIDVAVQLGGTTENTINLLYIDGLDITTDAYNQNSIGFKVFGCVECTFANLRANNFGTNLLVTPGDGRTAYNTFINPTLTRGYYNLHISGGTVQGYHCNENLVIGARCFWAANRTYRNIMLDAGFNTDWIFIEACCEGGPGDCGIECNSGSCAFYNCRLEGTWTTAGLIFGDTSQRNMVIAPRYDFSVIDNGLSNIIISNRSGNKLNGSTLAHSTLRLTYEGTPRDDRYFIRCDNVNTNDVFTVNSSGAVTARALNLPNQGYNFNSFTYGPVHFWLDTLGYLRQKGSAPTAADDGEVVGQRFRQAAYTPVNVVGPRYIGEEFLNTANNTWYKACTMASSGWVALN